MQNYDECRTYVEHLLAEHRRLHRMLLHARKAIAGDSEPDRGNWTGKVIRVLRDTRAELKCHFAEEEGGGCLDEAVSFRPQLGPELKRIEAQHPRLLADLDLLIAQVADYNGTLQDRLAVERGFDELCRELHAHEAAENAILQQGFGAIIDADESDRMPLATHD